MGGLMLIKNRSDIGAGTRGSDMGIDAMEIAAINVQNDFFHRVPFVDVETSNDSIYIKNTFPFARRIEYVYLQCRRVSDAVRHALAQGFFPLVLSGDHSSALGTMSGLKTFRPEARLGVVWIDAHADLHSPYTSPSGNIHGMPLAAAMNVDNLAQKVRDISPEVQRFWDHMKRIGTEEVKVLPSDLVYFGLRDFEKEEMELISKLGIRYFPVESVRQYGVQSCCEDALAHLQSCDYLYLSFDVDSMDSRIVSEGTGTPVPKGFNPHEILALLKSLLASRKVISVEFCEINPLLDKQGNKMAETAFSILDQISGDCVLPSHF